MSIIKTHFRLLVCGMFNVGQWDHYPTDDEIKEALNKRFSGQYINGERITFQVEKLQFVDPDELQVGDVVEVIEPFYFYIDYYEKGKRFTIDDSQVKHGFEKFVKRV